MTINEEQYGSELHFISSCKCCRVDNPDDEGEPCKSSERASYLCYHAQAALRALSERRRLNNGGLITVYGVGNADAARAKAKERQAYYGRFRPEGSGDEDGLPVVFFPSRRPVAPAPATPAPVAPANLQQQIDAAVRAVLAGMQAAPVAPAPTMDVRTALMVAAGLDPTGFCELSDDELRAMIARGAVKQDEPPVVKLKATRKKK